MMQEYQPASALFQLQEKGTTLIYAPLKGILCEADPKLLNCICDIEEQLPVRRENLAYYKQLKEMGLLVEKPNQKDPSLQVVRKSLHPKKFLPVEVTLFLTANCNLSCRYCYGHGGDSKTVMSEEIALAAVDTVFNNAKAMTAPIVRVSFHGGGEPTMQMNRIRQVVATGLERAKRQGIRVEFGLTTNGCSKRADVLWIAEHIEHLNISFDGPGDIQDYQRPMSSGTGSFSRISATLKLLDSLKKKYCLRGTITNYSEGRIPEIASYVAKNHLVHTLQLEPMFSVGRALTDEISPPDHDLFVQGFLEAEEICLEAGIGLKFSGHKFPAPCEKFCSLGENNFAVTPGGKVTSCFEVLDEKDTRSEKFFFGQYEHFGFSFDMEQLARLKELNDTIPEYCRNCFAQYHCRGDCRGKGLFLAKDDSYRGGGRCRIIQGLLKAKLLKYFR